MSQIEYELLLNTPKDTLIKCLKSEHFYEKYIDRYVEFQIRTYDSLETNNYSIDNPFPSYISRKQFLESDLFENIPNFQIIAEYNYSDGFARTLYHNELHENFVVKYKIKKIDPFIAASLLNLKGTWT